MPAAPSSAGAAAPRGPVASDREVRGWQLYDWANSAFFTTVVAALAGPYVTALGDEAAGADGVLVSVTGFDVRPGSWFAFVVSASVLMQVPLLPLLGALADRAGQKRRLLALTCAVGAGATCALPLAAGGAWLVGGLLFGLANVAAGASIVLYNAFLNDVAAPEDRDAVSSRGFALGYAGGGLLLMLDLVLVTQAESVGLSTGTAVRLSLLSAGVWWAGFGAVAIARLRAGSERGAAAVGSLAEVRAAVRDLRRLPGTLRFLVAYLLYNDAVQAVIALSAVFLTQELYVARGRPAEDATSFLLSLVLLIQFVAVGGALLFARLARRTGTKRAVVLSLVIWCAVVLYAFALLDSTAEALGLGAVIGVVLGGSQALSRSLFSRMLPAGREASFFGFYVIAERGTSWLAPALFGVVQSTTGSYRAALLSLVVLFAAGLVVLLLTDTDAAEREAQALPAATAA